MSYILDALKKSEAERSSTDQHGSGHRVSFGSTPGKQREIWPYLLALALMANAAVVAYLAWPESGPGNEAGVPSEVAPVPSPQPEEEATESEAPETASASKPSNASGEDPPASSEESTEAGSAETDRNPPEEVASPERTAEAPEPEDVPPIHDMPRSVQQRVPEMTFNGHVWSSRSSSRSVMINNRLLREGARFQGLVIEEITAAGVVFRMDGHVFEIDVVRDWQGGG